MDSRRRVVCSLVLVALVALAGCTSGPLGDSPGTDATDASTTESLGDLSFPDGANDEAVVNGTALAAAHTDVLSETGYVVELAASHSSAQRSQSSTYVVRRDAETGELHQRVVEESGSTEERLFAYANETATYQKRGVDSPSYQVETSTTSDDQATNNVVRAVDTLVLLGNWTDPSVVSTDGRTFVEYDFGGVSTDAEFIDAEAVTNASGSLLVDLRGVVHRVTLNVTRERDGTSSTGRYEYRVETLGDVTVEKPDWVSTAVEQDESATTSGRVTVVAGVGNVEDGRVETVNLTVMRAAGASDIDLSKAAIEWVGPDRATTLTASGSTTGNTFAIDAVKDADDSAPVLDEQDDRFTLTMDASEVGSGLEAGDELQLTITTQYGAKTTYWATVPEELSNESAVSL